MEEYYNPKERKLTFPPYFNEELDGLPDDVIIILFEQVDKLEKSKIETTEISKASG